MIADISSDDLAFSPTIILPATRIASKEAIFAAKKQFDDDVEQLLIQTKEFAEQMMLGKGLFYTRLENIIYFHDVYGIKDGDNFGSIFLACYPGKKGVEFKEEADVILHLHLLSDLALFDQIAAFNTSQKKDISLSYTHYYFNNEDLDFRKRVLVPEEVVSHKKSLIEPNGVFKLFESEITIEDLEELKRVMKLLLKKMKITKNSKIM